MRYTLKHLKNFVMNSVERCLPAEKDSKLARDAVRFWGDSIQLESRRDHSHWRGAGQWKDARWAQMGEKNYQRFKWLCFLAERPEKSIRSMVEWGPGGGANLVRFAAQMSSTIGIDISGPNLEECQRQLAAIDCKSFQPILIPAEEPADCLDQIRDSVDFFLSTAVFQHFPSKRYGISVLEVAANLLSSGGLALIQIRYDDSISKFSPKKRNYGKNAMTFTSYALEEFWTICRQSGLRPLALQLNEDMNYAYFFLKRD